MSCHLLFICAFVDEYVMFCKIQHARSWFRFRGSNSNNVNAVSNQGLLLITLTYMNVLQ